MKRNYWLLAIVFLLSTLHAQAGEWIRINQLGYLSQSKKVAVFMSEVPVEVNNYSLVDVFTGKRYALSHLPGRQARSDK